MSIDVLFIHGAGPQSGDQGSTPFVKKLRRGLGATYKVTCPTMPVPTKPSYERWKLELEKRLPDGRSPQILVGHSLGGSVLLKYLSEQNRVVRAVGLFIVAAPYWDSTDWEVEEFVLQKDFSRSFPSTLKIHLYQSRNDEVVPMEHLSHYAKSIPEAKVRTVEDGGHTFKDGLPELVQDIQALPIQKVNRRRDGA
jgi:predicted alpha/beta hydrolase family esterase